MNSDSWETPPNLFAALSEMYGPFDLDAAAIESNSLCPQFLSDAFAQKWCGERIWCNPPYSQIPKFLRFACASEKRVVCLLPSKTEVAWWHDFVMPHANEVLFLRRRVIFTRPDRPTDRPSFGSCVVVFGPGKSMKGQMISIGPRFGSMNTPKERAVS